MHPTAQPATAIASTDAWAPSLAGLRLVGNGRSVAMLSPEASVLWWCAPEFDDPPLCWGLLDPSGGTARFPDLQLVEADDTPAGVSATTLLRDDHGLIEVRDSVLPRDDGVLLVRLLRRRTQATAHVGGEVRHELRLGGFDAPRVSWALDTDAAAATLEGHDRRRTLQVRGGRQEVRDGALLSSLAVGDRTWTALVVGVDAVPDGTPEALAEELDRREATEHRRLDGCRLPRTHPRRALDALAVIRACTSQATGAVVAARRRACRRRPGTTASSTTATPGCATRRCPPPSPRCSARGEPPAATSTSSTTPGKGRTC